MSSQLDLGTNRNYCFTAWKIPEYNPNTMKYMIYGEEMCPRTKTIHYQGYVELKSPARVVTCKKYFNDDTIHLEKRRGSKNQAIDYCKKDGKFLEFGGKPSESSITKEGVSSCNFCNNCGSTTGEFVASYSGKPVFRCGPCFRRRAIEVMDMFGF